jgi:hypothetical protein
MRGTLIIYAHPETLRLMAQEQVRFSGHGNGSVQLGQQLAVSSRSVRDLVP